MFDKKILYITNGINGSNGLERVLSIKASYFTDVLNHEVHILTLNNGDKNRFFDFSNKITFYDIKVNSTNPIGFFLSYKNGIQKVLDEIKPDIIIVCDDGIKGIMFPVIFRKCAPVIYERHAAKEFNISSNKILYKVLRRSINRFDSFIVLTEGNKRDWPGVTCTVIPNPSPYLQSINNYEKQKTVLAVGSQSYNKGFDLLINIWEIVNEKYPDWNLKIFGKQNKLLGLEKLVEKKNLLESVTFYSSIKSIDEEYKKASIFALSSRNEGFGMVLIEAMSFGTPCVSFDCPHGPADIITDKEDGFLIKNGDIDKFADALIKLIKDEDRRLTMGRKASENVKKYNIKNIALKWDSLFKEIIHNNIRQHQ